MKYNVMKQNKIKRYKTLQNKEKIMRNMKFVKRIGVVALAACMILSCVGCGSSSNKGAAEGTTEIAAEGGQTKISVAAAASLQATFDDELIPLFEKENPGVTVEGTYASSGDLQQQIESGLDADVFFSAATSNMDTLVDENLVDKDTVVDLLKNDVVLITPKDSKLGIKGFKDITKADTIAIGDPESVPAGKYAKEILTNLGVYDEVEKQITKDAPSRLHARRQMMKVFYPVKEVPAKGAGKKKNTKDVDMVKKMFEEIAPKYANRNGGYTRIVKIGQRKGDGAMEVLIELV